MITYIIMKHIHIGRSLPVDVKLKDNLISFASVNRQIWTASILSVSGNNQVYTLRNQQWNRRLNAGTVYEAEFIVSTTSGVSPSFSFLMEDHPACDDVTSEVYRNTFRTRLSYSCQHYYVLSYKYIRLYKIISRFYL